MKSSSCLVSGAMKILIWSFTSSCVKLQNLGSSFLYVSREFMVEFLSEMLFSLKVVVPAVSFLFAFLSSQIEPKDCMQVSRVEFVDEFR